MVPRGVSARVSWIIVVVVGVVVVVAIGVSVILLSGPQPELLASDSGTASADSWYSLPITVPSEEFTSGIPRVEIALSLDDSRAEITWHFYSCDMPNCVIILPGRGGFDLTTGADFVEGFQHVNGNSMTWSFNALDGGSDMHFYFIWVQTVGPVGDSGYSASARVTGYT